MIILPPLTDKTFKLKEFLIESKVKNLKNKGINQDKTNIEDTWRDSGEIPSEIQRIDMGFSAELSFASLLCAKNIKFDYYASENFHTPPSDFNVWISGKKHNFDLKSKSNDSDKMNLKARHFEKWRFDYYIWLIKRKDGAFYIKGWSYPGDFKFSENYNEFVGEGGSTHFYYSDVFRSLNLSIFDKGDGYLIFGDKRYLFEDFL